MYYLQSRYYDPNTGRFLNADAFTSTGQGLLGNNMFAYCRNNPISRKDVSGTTDVSVTVDDDGNPSDDLLPEAGCAGANVGGNSAQNNSPAGGSSGYTYSPPNGGGGVTTEYIVGDKTVTFGHGGRHPGFQDISGLEQTIANDVVYRPPTSGYRGEYDVTYGGYIFTYRYWTVSPTHINVGTYFYKVSK